MRLEQEKTITALLTNNPALQPLEDVYKRQGVECAEDAEAPAGWTKWTIPGYAYLRAEVEDETTFSQVLDYMRANQIPLAGAVHDFTCPASGKQYLFFPIRRL